MKLETEAEVISARHDGFTATNGDVVQFSVIHVLDGDEIYRISNK